MWEEFLPWLIGRLNGLHMQRITLNLSLRFHVAAHKRAAFFIQRITLFSSGWVCTQSGRCVGFAPCKVDKAVPTCGHTGAASSRLAAGPGGSAPGRRQSTQVELANNLKGSRNIHLPPFNNYGELRGLGEKTSGKRNGLSCGKCLQRPQMPNPPAPQSGGKAGAGGEGGSAPRGPASRLGSPRGTAGERGGGVGTGAELHHPRAPPPSPACDWLGGRVCPPRRGGEDPL